MRSTMAVVAVCIGIISPTLLGQEPNLPRRERATWEWPAADRIRLRTNPVTVQSLLIKEPRFALRLEGRKNPELLLPMELFRNLLSGLQADPMARTVLREAYAPVTTRLNLPNGLLDQLLVIADEYLARDSRIQSLNERLATSGTLDAPRLSAERDALSQTQCATLFDALTAARKRYGTSQFDRFLYEAVAPGMVVTIFGPEEAGELAWWERGCR